MAYGYSKKPGGKKTMPKKASKKAGKKPVSPKKPPRRK